MIVLYQPALEVYRTKTGTKFGDQGGKFREQADGGTTIRMLEGIPRPRIQQSVSSSSLLVIRVRRGFYWEEL